MNPPISSPPPSDQSGTGANPKRFFACILVWVVLAALAVSALATGFAVLKRPLIFKSIFLPPVASERGACEDCTATTPVTSKEEKPTTILFVGDIFFDRYIRHVSARKGSDFVFSCIDDLLETVDFAVGNLEGPITEYDSVSMGTVIGSPENFVFTFPTTTAELLLRHHIGVVNLGNNHINNFGQGGIDKTKQFLNDAGVGYFGGVEGNEPVYQTDRNISFVSYNKFGGQSQSETASVIAQEKEKGRIVIVFAHWGEEYSRSVATMQDAAELFVERGADAIFGSHPHVIIPRTDVGGAPVYYSLGNFIFDQYWNEEVRSGLAVLLTIDRGRITTTEYHVTLMPDGRTCPQ